MAKPDRKPPRKRTGPPKPEDLTPQVGRRPSPPVFLFVIALSWVLAGIVALVALSASWKLVPGIVFIGIGLMYLRAAITTLARRG